jgi:hypothetical protein
MMIGSTKNFFSHHRNNKIHLSEKIIIQNKNQKNLTELNHRAINKFKKI